MTSLGQGTGIQTAALAAGGHPGSPPYPLTNTSSEYNGSGWAAGGTLNTAGNSASQANNGTQTAALIWGRYVGGSPGASAASEEYNGTSWTSGNSRSVANYRGAGGGTQTAAFGTGGNNGSTQINSTEEYDGTNWSGGGVIGTASMDMSGAGTLTAGIIMGGDSGPPTTLSIVQNYDGTSWTTATALPTERQEHGGVGLQTAALVFGGKTGPGAGTAAATTSASYDGTNWTAGGSLATGRQEGTNAGTSISALFAGGTPTPAYNLTEEYNVSTNAITAAAWSAGGNLPAPVSSVVGAGIQTAALSISGQPSAPGVAATAATNEYDGSSWTAGGSLAAGAASYGGQSANKGTQTAALYWKGYNPTPTAGYRDTVSSYDGSSWTAQTTLAGAAYGGNCGTQTAALSIGGLTVTAVNESDASYNWTAGGVLSTARYANGAVGPQTAALTAGGVPGTIVKTESYNGTSWTTLTDIPAGGNTKDQTFGTDSNDAMFAGGSPNKVDCLKWDGTSWATAPSLSTGRNGGSGAGASGSSGLIAGGQSPFTTATEEFTAATSAINIETLTTS
jgi:hypothetical protein